MNEIRMNVKHKPLPYAVRMTKPMLKVKSRKLKMCILFKMQYTNF